MSLERENDVVFVAARRTPIGSFGGSFKSLQASDLGAAVIRGLLKDLSLPPEAVDEVIIGQVLTGGTGQNPARQAAIQAGLPVSCPAFTINKVCGSGLKAVQLAAQAVRCGDAQVVIAGGQECMSKAGHSVHLREGQRLGDVKLEDTLLKDGLTCAFNKYHMGVTAENVAERCSISREEQDHFAANSQEKANKAQQAGKFEDQIVGVEVSSRKGTVVVDKDEYLKPGTSAQSLAKLKPAFKKQGTVTAGNASGINDGAALVVVTSRSRARSLGLPVLGVFKSFASVGVDPKLMGLAPVNAATAALNKAGWTPGDLDLIEANEAFAAQAAAVNKEMGWNVDKVNVNGGAIAIGHPIGASGCRILVDLIHEMKRRNSRKGLATLCIGGGQGVALCVESDAVSIRSAL